MAIQRNRPINIDYQVPADVAGLAGQRAAISEAEAISQNQSRKMAETQDIVKANLAAQDTFARIKHTEMQIELDKQKAAHTAQIQNAELDHQMNIDWNKMQNEWDLLPLEKRRMELANEAQDIENEWAADEKEAELEGTELDNAAKRKQLEDSKNLGAYERSKRQWVKDGGAPDNFVWGGPAFTGQAARDRAAIDARMAKEGAAKRNQDEANEHNGIYDTATPAQQGLLQQTEAVPGQPGARQFKFKNENGNGYNEKGQALLRRLERQKKIELTAAERDTLREDGGGWTMDVNGDAVVLNDAGLIEYEGRRAMTKSLWKAVDRTVDSTGKETITYEKPDKKIEDAVMKSYTAWREAQVDKSLEPTDAQIQGWRSTAMGIIGSSAHGMSLAAIASAEGEPLYLEDESGARHPVITRGGVTTTTHPHAGPDGVLGTDDDGKPDEQPDPPQGGSVGEISRGLGTVVASQQEVGTKDRQYILSSADKDLPYKDSLGYSQTDWDGSPMTKIGGYHTQLMMPTSETSAYAGSKLEGGGYGATKEEADKITSLIKARALDYGLTETNTDARQQINWAVDYYSDQYVEKHREKLAKLLGLDDYMDKTAHRLVSPVWGRFIKGPRNKTSARESDEIISTEIADSSVKLPNGKYISVREFVKRDANEMLGAKLQIPWAREEKSEGGTPNAPTGGNIHDPNRRRRTREGRGGNMALHVTLFPHHFKGDIGEIKKTLENIIKYGDELKGLGKFIRYSEVGEYD